MVVLGYSRLLHLRFSERQDMRTLFAGLEAAFASFGGVPREVLFDQMRAVISADLRLVGGQLMVNEEFLRFAAHYGFRPRACRPYRARTKGKVERPIRYARGNFVYGRDFIGDEHLADELAGWLEHANERLHATTKEAPRERFERDEHALLLPLPARPYRSLLLPPERERVALERHAARLASTSAPAPTSTAVPTCPLRGGREAPARHLRGHRRRCAMKRATSPITPVPSRRERLMAMLADLKMPGALEALDGVLQGVDGGRLTPAEAIEALLGAQITLRNNRRLQAAMRSTRLPAVKTLADFDFSFQPSIKREQIESLHELGFLERKENVVLLGPPGVGKTHLAISLAITAAERGRRVYYGTLSDLITSLEEAQAAGLLQQRLKVLTHPALLVVDEIGYLPISRTGAMLFFQLMARRYERASTVMTSNKGFEEWGEVFGDEVMAAALIDRVLHHCHIVSIRGNSYRMRQHRALWSPQPQDPAST